MIYMAILKLFSPTDFEKMDGGHLGWLFEIEILSRSSSAMTSSVAYVSISFQTTWHYAVKFSFGYKSFLLSADTWRGKAALAGPLMKFENNHIAAPSCVPLLSKAVLKL